jgi:trimeric autotransporter adhesin
LGWISASTLLTARGSIDSNVTTRSFLSALLALSPAVTPPLWAQCQPSWGGSTPLPASNGTIADAVDWDPDGTGPQPALVVFGGTFTSIANIQANNVAAFNPQTNTWSTLGMGVTAPPGNGCIRSVAVHQGMLVVGGRIATAGGNPMSAIARFNGTTWSGLGSGLGSGGGAGGLVNDLVVDAAGQLVAGGLFTNASGTSVVNCARWNGTTWSAMGTELTGGTVDALLLGPAGAVVAGGSFDSFASTGVRYVAQFNGTNWLPLGAFPGPVVALATAPGGVLAAAGAWNFGVRTFNGATWAVLGTLNAPIADLEVANGELFAGAYSGIPGGVARFTAGAWTPIGANGGSAGVLHASGVANALLFASYVPRGGILCETMERRDSTSSAMSLLVAGATNGPVRASTVAANGDVVVAGDFTSIQGVAANRIARWNGTTWAPLGAGMNESVLALLTLPNGDIIAGGGFTQAGGIPVSRIARWNGSSWSDVSGGRNGVVRTLGASTLSGTEFFVGGDFPGFMARHFSAPGAGYGTMVPLLNGAVNTIASLPNGDVVAGGEFTVGGTTALNHIGRFAFGAWSPLGNGTNGPVRVIHVLPSGELVVGGNFDVATSVSAEKIALWNGTAWSNLGSGMAPIGVSAYGPSVEAIAALPNGDLIVAGDFSSAGGAPDTKNIARWNGASWAAVANPGSHHDAQTVVHPYAIAMSPEGSLFVGGGFTAIGATGVGYFARLQAPCLASGESYGSGCSGAAGPVSIAMISRPWIGSTYRSQTTGIPSGAAVFATVGFNPIQPAVPLSTFIPQALSGCEALVQPDTSLLLTHVSGVAQNAIPIAPDPALVGVNLFEQSVVFEMSGSTVVGATSSNALKVTVGSL